MPKNNVIKFTDRALVGSRKVGPGCTDLVWPIAMLLLTILLTACTTLGPDFVKPTAPVEERMGRDGGPSDKGGISRSQRMVEGFQRSGALDNLIEMASEQNLSLRVAGLRILESRALLGIAVGLQYPQAQQLNGGIFVFKIKQECAAVFEFS